jgi:adenylate kinase
MRIVLFGPPGAGKGTQARLLAERHRLFPISTGQMIRSEMDEQTSLGEEAVRYVNGGRLLPFSLVSPLVEDAIESRNFDDFVLDGYPRTLEQAEQLTSFLNEHEAPLHAVISLQLPLDVITERLSRRRVHRVTGQNYHLDFNPPPPDVDPQMLIQRQDDQPEAIRCRIELYLRETQPVEAFYQERGCFHAIDGVGDIEVVYQRIEGVVAGLPTRRAQA